MGSSPSVGVGRQTIPRAPNQARRTAARVFQVGGWPIRAYFLLLVLLFVVAAGAASLYVRDQADRDARRSAQTQAAFAATTASKQLGIYLALLRSSVAGLAANPRIANTFAHPQGCTLSFSGLGGPDHGHLDIISPLGAVACSSKPPGTSPAPPYRSESWLALALKQPVFIAPVVDPRTGVQMSLTTVPIPGGKGVVAAFADLGALGRELAAQYAGGQPVEFLVVKGDDEGTVIARSIGGARAVGTSLHGTAFASSSRRVERRDLDGLPRLYASTPVPGVSWRLYAGEDKAAVLGAAGRLANRQLLIILIGLAAFLLAATLTYLSLVRPLSRLRASVRKTSADARPLAVPAGGPTEIKGLADEINGLIESVDRELTERQRAEEILQASERNYRLLFESNPHPMWAFDVATLRFLAVNDAAVRSYGYSRDEFLAMTIEEIRPAEDIPLLRDVVDVAENRGLNAATIWRHQRRDGSIIEVEITSHAHEFEGKAARVVLALDVSELRASEARYRDLFENATDLIATTDLDGRLTNVNQAFVNALGYSREELIGKPLLELVPPESHGQLQVARADKLSADQHATIYEHDLIAKDGRRLQIEVSSRLIEANGQASGVEAICRDVTDRRRLEDQLRQTQRLEAIGQLAGGIAHDFNNLLTVIGGYTDAILKAPEHSHDRELTQIAGASARAATLTRQLLAFSRRQMLLPRVIDLNEIVGNLTPMLERVIGEDLELVAALDPELDHVVADAGQIEQVLMNLAVNARDAMPNGGKLTIETGNVMLDEHYAETHPDSNAGPHAMLAVSDTGAGIDPDILERVFEPFFTTKPLGTGTGLGLATVHGIVKQSGGNIWVYSEPGHGTTFKIYLPAVSADVTDHRDTAPTHVPGGTETILVVEDEPSLRSLVGDMLELNGYNVIIAESSTAALDLVENERPSIDLLLTDLIMPQLGGRDLAARIKRTMPTVNVLFMSGYSDEAVNRNGTLEAEAAYLEKPFSGAELARKIRATLDAV
jgi:PAS domain S-box-containing protein